MTAYSWSSPLRYGSDADFQSFSNGVSGAFAACLTKTADTGQITVPITATKPGATNTTVGYEVFRFKDPFQATFPLFLRVDYGTSGDSFKPCFRITLGTGTNGAGTITGLFHGPDTITMSSDPGNSTTYEHAAGAGDDGYFWIAFAVANEGGGSTHNFFFFTERWRNASGAPIPGAYSGRLQQTTGSAVTHYFSVLPPTGPLGHVNLEWPIMFPSSQSGSELLPVGGNIPLFPIEPFYGRRMPPCLGMIGCRNEDVGQGVVATTTLLGKACQFRRITGNHFYQPSALGKGSYSNKRLCGRWEP